MATSGIGGGRQGTVAGLRCFAAPAEGVSTSCPLSKRRRRSVKVGTRESRRSLSSAAFRTAGLWL